MPIKEKIIGTGMTKRRMTTVRLDGDVGPEEIEAVGQILERAGGCFEDRLGQIEPPLQQILENSTDQKEKSGPQHRYETIEWYARHILDEIEWARKFVKGKNADEAARSAFMIRALYTEMVLKFNWDRPAEYGLKRLKEFAGGRRKTNKERSNQKKRKVEQAQEAASELWRTNAHLSASDVASSIQKQSGISRY